MTPPRQAPAHRHVPARARVVVVALALGIVAALAVAERADAGDYVVTQCSSVTPFVQASWERSSEHYRQRALCGTDGGLQVFHGAETTQLGGYGAWVWRAPSGTVFTDVQANASLTNQAGHHGELAVVRTDGGMVPFGSEHNDFRVHSIHGEFTQFHAWLRCAAPGAGQPCGRAGEDAAHAYVRGVYLRTVDRVGPRLVVAGGSLLEPGVIRGTRGLAFAASDVGSGIRKVFVEGNGSLLVTDVRNCMVAAGFATALRPCPAGTFESAAVPTVLVSVRHWAAQHGHGLRRGPGARRRPEPGLRAATGVGGQRLPVVHGRRRHRGQRRIRRRLGGERNGRVRPLGVRPRAGHGGWAWRDRLRAHPSADRRAADRRRRNGDDRRRRRVRDRAPTWPEPRGLRPLRRRRPGARPPWSLAALGRHADAGRPSQPRRPQPRPDPLLGHASGPGVLRSRGQGPGAARQAPLAGLPHRPRRRGLSLHRPLQAPRDRAREALPVPRARPPGRRLPLRAWSLADGEGQGAPATPRAAPGLYDGSRARESK